MRSTTLASYPFDTTTISPSLAANIAAFSASGSQEASDSINWVRCKDNARDENLNRGLSDIRASVHGDVLHSRPAVVNYNRYGNDNDVVVFYGANDGLFRAIKSGTGKGPRQSVYVTIVKLFTSELSRVLKRNLPPRQALDARC